MKLNKHVVMVALTGVGVITSVVLSFRAGMRAQKVLEELDNGDAFDKPNMLQKAVIVGKEALPAMASMAATGVTMYAEFTGREKELGKIKTKLEKANEFADLAVKKGNQTVKHFNQYRGAVREIDGKEKDIEYSQKAAELHLDENGNKRCPFVIDWIEGEEIRFEESLFNVEKALTEVNRYLLDPNVRSWGTVTVSDFLEFLGHPELKTEKTDKAGWDASVLAADCGCYWLDFYPMEGDDGVWSIETPWYPNSNIQKYIEELADEGVI